MPALTAAVAIAGTVAARSPWRLYQQKQTKRELQGAAPLINVGAGEGGEQIVKALLSDPTSTYEPVALLDDDPARARYSISGVRVRGPVSQMREVAARYGAEHVLLAIPSAPRELVRDVDSIASNAGLKLLVLPSVVPLVIVGAGGFGRECLDVVDALNDVGAGIEFRGFLDDGHVDTGLLERMIADVPLGAFLSGGVDSTLVVAMMQRHGVRAQTYTIGFEDEALDEAPAARLIADMLGAEHRVDRHGSGRAGSRPTARRPVRRAVRRFVTNPDDTRESVRPP